MSPVRLDIGSCVSVSGKIGIIVDKASLVSVRVRFDSGDERDVLVSKLCSVPSRRFAKIAIPVTPTAEELRRGDQRRKAVEPLFRGIPPDRANRLRISASEWQRRSEESGYPVDSLRRWFNRVRDAGTFDAVYYPAPLCGKGKTRGGARVQKILEECVNQYLDRQQASVADIVVAVQGRCDREGIDLKKSGCSENTIRRRLAKIPRAQAILARRGLKALEAALASHPEGFPALNHPLDLVMVDEGKLDVTPVDSGWRQAIRRPHLLGGISVSTLMVWSVALFDRVCRACDFATLIYRGVLPKEEFIRQFMPTYDAKGLIPWTPELLAAEMPIWGHANLHADNGAIFRANHLKEYNQRYRADGNFRPVATPSSGGFIENLIKQINAALHRVRGTTWSNPGQRGDQASESRACMTLEALMCFILLELRKWHNTPKETLGDLTPMQKLTFDYLGGVRGLPHPQPPIVSDLEDRRRLWISLLPKDSGTIQEYGIKRNGLNYMDDRLRLFQKVRGDHKKSPKLEYAFHPDAPELIYVRMPDQPDTFIDVPCRNIDQITRRREIAHIAPKMAAVLPKALTPSGILSIREEQEHIVLENERATKTIRRAIEKAKFAPSNLPNLQSRVEPRRKPALVLVHDQDEDDVPLSTERS